MPARTVRLQKLPSPTITRTFFCAPARSKVGAVRPWIERSGAKGCAASLPAYRSAMLPRRPGGKVFSRTNFFETDRDAACRPRAGAVQRQKHRSLQKTQGPDQVDMKGRRERIAMILRLRDRAAVFFRRVSSTATATRRPGQYCRASRTIGSNKACGFHAAREWRKYSPDQLFCSRPWSR